MAYFYVTYVHSSGSPPNIYHDLSENIMIYFKRQAQLKSLSYFAYLFDSGKFYHLLRIIVSTLSQIHSPVIMYPSTKEH